MADWMYAWHIFAIIGAIKVLCYLIPFLSWWLFSCVHLKDYMYGYVLVTGATDGIGKSIAKDFVKRGFKVILVSRSLEKLKQVQESFLTTYPGSTVEIIASDFSYSHRDPINFYQDLFEQLSVFPISVLVNNVGVATVKMLNNDTYDSIESMIGVNVYPATMLTHRLMPLFLQRYEQTGQKSLVINMSSTMDESVFPGNAVYSATKRYAFFLSEALRYEYTGKVLFATVKPGLVITPMVLKNHTQGLPLSTDPDSFAQAMLGGLRTSTNHAHWKHKILGALLNAPPYLLTVLLVRMSLPTAVRKGIVS